MVAILGWDSEYILKIKPTGFLDEKALSSGEEREELSTTKDFVLSNQKDRDAVEGEVEDYKKQEFSCEHKFEKCYIKAQGCMRSFSNEIS